MQIDSSYDDKILACLTKDYKHTEVLISSGLKPEHFDTVAKQNYAKICIHFFNQYKSTFTDHSFVLYIDDLVRTKKIPKEDQKHYFNQYAKYSNINLDDIQFFVDKIVKFIKKQEYKRLFEDAVSKDLPNEDFASIEKRFEKIKTIGDEQSFNVVNYFETLEERIERRKNGVVVGISTGIPQLDEQLYHKGWGFGELSVVLGATKMGKTHALLYFAQQASARGYNVVYFSCEVSANILADRLDTSYSDIFFDELNFAHDKVINKIRDIREKSRGDIFLSYHPTKTLTVTKSKNIVERIEHENNCKIDMVIYDYGDIMCPEVASDKRLQIGDIFERMRGFAGEKGIAVLSASQLNRDGAKKAVTQATDIAEDFSKIMTADVVIGLNASESEFAQGKIRVSMVANRNGAKKTFTIQSNYAKMRFFEGFVEYESF